MSERLVERDERTLAVENAGYRWSYIGLAMGVLVVVAYRGWLYHQSSWDLLALVVLSGGFNAAYQGRKQVLARGWVVMTVVTFVVAGVVAAGIALLRRG
jgi:hypothetical protein